MKKLKISSLLLVSLIAGVSSSCVNENDTLVDVRGVKSIVTIDKTNITLVEGNSTAITITIDKPLSEETTFKIDLTSEGSTGVFRDFSTSGVETTPDESGFGKGEIGYTIAFPAYVTKVTFTIDAVLDLMTEPTEVLNLRLSSTGSGLALVDPSSESIRLTINDAVSTDLGFKLDWTQSKVNSFGVSEIGTYLGADNKKHGYDSYDFDMYVFDSAFNQLDGNQAATGNAPEQFILSGSTLADGDYLVVADKYSNPSAATAPSSLLQLPATMTVSKMGTWTKDINISYFNSATGISAPNGLTNGVFIVAIINKTGSIYTLSDYTTNEVLIQGKVAQLNQTILNLRKNKK